MPQKQVNWFAIGIIALLVYAFVPAVNTAVNGIFGAAPGAPAAAPQAVAPVAEFCADPSVTMRIGPMSKMYAPGTSVSGEFARLFVGGVDQGLKADSTTFGVSWKDDVNIYYAENSSTYYAAKTSFKVPCRSTIDSATFDSDSHKLYQTDASTNLNLKIFNEDDGLLNNGTGGSNADTEALTAGDTVTLDASIQGNYQDAFSPYGAVYVTVKSNSSLYDDIQLTATTAGYSFSDASTPQFRATSSSATGFNLKTFKLNKGLISNQKVDFTVYIDVDDTNEPATENGGGEDITFYFDDEDWSRNSETGAMEFGTETNLDADVGDTTDNTKILQIA